LRKKSQAMISKHSDNWLNQNKRNNPVSNESVNLIERVLKRAVQVQSAMKTGLFTGLSTLYWYAKYCLLTQ